MSHLYQSDDWKQLEPIDRAQLLLVLEGIKSGTIIGGNWTSFQRVVKETGLDYSLTSRKYDLRLVAAVAKPDVLAEYNQQFLKPDRMKAEGYHHLTGEFLGFPTCCISEYSRERTPEEKQARKKRNHLHTYTFGRELDALIKQEGKYPEVFDYRPPSFTPCTITCENAIAKLTQWKEALDKYDPEAARELKALHRRGKPESTVHAEFLKDYRKIHEPEHEESRRMWLGGEYNHTFPHLLRQLKQQRRNGRRIAS